MLFLCSVTDLSTCFPVSLVVGFADAHISGVGASFADGVVVAFFTGVDFLTRFSVSTVAGLANALLASVLRRLARGLSIAIVAWIALAFFTVTNVTTFANTLKILVFNLSRSQTLEISQI